MVELAEVLQFLVDCDGSDLHLCAGEPPIIRVHGYLLRMETPPLTEEDTTRLLGGLLDNERQARFAERRELEMSYATDTARFRVGIFLHQGQVGAVFRLIPLVIRSMDDLELPTIARDLCLRPRGLLLVTGPTGSGKSTTLAALVDHINAHRHAHIITIEDPIEYLHTDRMSAVDQREVGSDTHSFLAALHHALRQAPDVLVLSGMPDLETIRQAIHAAEMGHLVLSAMHTGDATHSIDRLVELFPAEEQHTTRSRIAATLLGVISQALLPRMDTPGCVAAFEVMIAVPAIRSLIRDGKTQQIMADIQTGSQYGMESLDHALAALVRRKLVRYEDALAKSANPRDFEQRVGIATVPRR